MAKSKTPTFITELPLIVSDAQEQVLLARLEAGRQLYNACLGEAVRRVQLIKQSKLYQFARSLPKTKGGNIKFRPGRCLSASLGCLHIQRLCLAGLCHWYPQRLWRLDWSSYRCRYRTEAGNPHLQSRSKTPAGSSQVGSVQRQKPTRFARGQV